MRYLLMGALLLISFGVFSQKADSINSDNRLKIYQASATKINDLIHTKLDVSFDYSKAWMYGKAWLTLQPHFYPTDSLCLDAKGMSIIEVSMIKSGKHIPLKYIYDSLTLRITLDKLYKSGEKYTVYINYVAKPNDIKAKGSTVNLGAKGLYFVNPSGKDKNKPTQIWTQGETEANSCWFPTIDRPNQKTTDEISITVPDKYQTLSNGIRVSQEKNNNGTRTDTWKMELPHAPYLMMMAVGEFSIIKDSYKGKEVSYYVEKEYASVARKIFGLTPEMIAFFSRITGVDYPWPKYAQVVCKDFVTGAMENTTATTHYESAQQDARQLIDENIWEDVIAHELFHQWFGDYVTTESWSNITLNESFADYSETLWYEYKYGKDAGDNHNNKELRQYLQSNSDNRDLVRFYYKHREDMFDDVSYQKGGRILNMLRNYVGDSAFFKSLNLYLTTKKFKSAEAHDLRLAFEEVTGQDLNWFWNQWYYGSGHPKLDISYGYDANGKTAKVFLKQTQADKIFKFQIAVDVYQGSVKKRYKVWMDQIADTFSFPAATKPDLINVDGDKILLCEKKDHKSLENYIFQYANAGLYVDRREAIDYASTLQTKDPVALAFMKTAMNDRFQSLRIFTLRKLKIDNDTVKQSVEPLLADIAKNDPKSFVRAEAIELLGKYKSKTYKPLFLNSTTDSSYAIAGNALLALGLIDSVTAIDKARNLSSQHVKGDLFDAISNVMFLYSDEKDFDALASRFVDLPFGYAKLRLLEPFSDFLKRIKNIDNFNKGIDMILSFRDSLPIQSREWNVPYINDIVLSGIAKAKQTAGMTGQADYVNSKLPVKTKADAEYEDPK